MIHCQFLGSVFRSRAQPPSDDDMEPPIRNSGLLGRDPSDIRIVRRPRTTVDKTAEEPFVYRRRTRRKLVTPSTPTRINNYYQSSGRPNTSYSMHEPPPAFRADKNGPRNRTTMNDYQTGFTYKNKHIDNFDLKALQRKIRPISNVGVRNNKEIDLHVKEKIEDFEARQRMSNSNSSESIKRSSDSIIINIDNEHNKVIFNGIEDDSKMDEDEISQSNFGELEKEPKYKVYNNNENEDMLQQHDVRADENILKMNDHNEKEYIQIDSDNQHRSNNNIIIHNKKQDEALAETYVEETDDLPAISNLTPIHKNKKAQNVYFSKILPVSNPPSATTFLQINEMLDRLIENANVEDKINDYIKLFDEYHHVFGEVITQYFIECNDQGAVLENCRHNFLESKEAIPKVKLHFDNILHVLRNKVNAAINKNNQLIPEIEENEKHSQHLKNVIEDMKNELEQYRHRTADLTTSFSTVTKEIIGMKEEIGNLDQTIRIKEQALVDLNEKLAHLSDLTSQYTNNVLSFTDNLKSIRQKESKSQKEIDGYNNTIENIQKDLDIMDKEIEYFNNQIQKFRESEIKNDVECQVDIISRRLFRNKNNNNQTGDEKSNKSQKKKARKITEDDMFKNIKREFLKSIGKDPNTDDFSFDSYEEFAKLKKILLENERNFHLSMKIIHKAENGSFKLNDNTNTDMARLFASKIVKDSINNAIRGKSHRALGIQTLPLEVAQKEQIISAPTINHHSKLLAMTEVDYSNREPQKFDWLIQNIRILYHERQLINQKAFDEGHPFEPFYKTIYNYANSKFNLGFLRDQFCWDIYITSHALCGLSTEIEMFVGFLEEFYNQEQLAFYLICRRDCLSCGHSILVKTADEHETYFEFYIGTKMLEELMNNWWKNRYDHSFFLKMLDYSIPRPAINLESSQRYVAMNDILYNCVNDYETDTHRRLKEYLLKTKFHPKLRMASFSRLLKSLIPSLTQDDIISLHRSSVAKGIVRKNVSVNKFIDLFYNSSVLSHLHSRRQMTSDENELMNTINQCYLSFNNQFQRILEYFKKQTTLHSENLTLKCLYDDVERYYSILSDSLSSSNSKGCSWNYFRFLSSLDLLFSVVGNLQYHEEELSLESMECIIRENYFDSVF